MTDVQAPPAPAEATIGHNSAAVGEILRENPAAIFDEPDMLKQLVSELQDEIDAADVNLETVRSLNGKLPRTRARWPSTSSMTGLRSVRITPWPPSKPTWPSCAPMSWNRTFSAANLPMRRLR